jgi:Tol biopolymer transport system component
MDVAIRDCWVLSPDGESFAVLMRPMSAGQTYQIGISHPLGAPLRPYQPAPFASRDIYNLPLLRFSPDGKKLIFLRFGENNEEAWLLPYPASAARTPRRILTRLPSFTGAPQFSWLPDNRHIIVSLQIDRDSPKNLWVADTESDDLEAITAGNQNETNPVTSPDGKSLLYQEEIENYEVVSVSLADGSVKPLISTAARRAWLPGPPTAMSSPG